MVGGYLGMNAAETKRRIKMGLFALGVLVGLGIGLLAPVAFEKMKKLIKGA